MNIILILTDQHRYDILGVNGSTICKSPNLDALAQSGVNFDNAYSVCGVCMPARVSIYTGLYPSRHGLTRNIPSDSIITPRIPEHLPTLAERLNENNYSSHFIGKWHAGERLPTRAGFTGMDLSGYGDCRRHEDYHAYLEERGLDLPGIQIMGSGWAQRVGLAGKATGPVEASVPAYLAQRSIEYLDRQAKEENPFFLAVNFWGPHQPYLPSEPYASMYDPAEIPPWGNFNDDFAGKPPIYKRYRDAFIGEGQKKRSWEECAKWAALYFGFATQIDDQIGRILQKVKELGMEDHTAILFSCDHGDLCGAHGGMHDKGGMLCQELYHIPFMGRIPGGTEGKTCSLPISNMDLSKTILELGGISDMDHLDGRSLVPLLKGEEPSDWPDHVIAEFFGHHYAYEAHMVIHDGYKYIYHPAAFDELYNLEADPWELTNLIHEPSSKEMLSRMRIRLLDWFKGVKSDLVVPFGLFHKRLDGEASFDKNIHSNLRNSPTVLLDFQ